MGRFLRQLVAVTSVLATLAVNDDSTVFGEQWIEQSHTVSTRATVVSFGLFTSSTTTLDDRGLLNTVRGGLLAAERALQQQGIGSVSLQFDPANVRFTNCSTEGGRQAAEDIVRTTNIHIVLDGGCSSASVAAAPILDAAGVLQVSYSSTSFELDDKERFPWFMRINPSDQSTIAAMASVVAGMEWENSAVIMAHDESFSLSGGLAIYQELTKWLARRLLPPPVIGNFSSLDGRSVADSSVTNVVKRLKDHGVKVVVLFAHEEESILVLEESLRQGLLCNGAAIAASVEVRREVLCSLEDGDSHAQHEQSKTHFLLEPMSRGLGVVSRYALHQPAAGNRQRSSLC